MTEEEFRKLLAKYTKGEATAEEEKLVDGFVEAFERQAPASESPSGEMWSAIQSRLYLEKVKNDYARRKRTRRIRMQVSVLVLCLITTSTVWLGFQSGWFGAHEKTITWLTAQTTWGQKSTITLSDGTTIKLNSGSRLRYPEVFEEGLREVHLEGEAFFDVARNEHSPFVVKTKGVTTRVLGTSFNIEAFPDEQISVTVATGKVEVSASDTNERSNVLLTPNHQAVYDPIMKSLTTSQVDIDHVLAWKNSILKFDEATLSEVSTELERWYNVKIEFKSDRIKGCVISGQYKDQSLEHVLESIQYMYAVEYSFQSPNKVHLDGKGCN